MGAGPYPSLWDRKRRLTKTLEDARKKNKHWGEGSYYEAMIAHDEKLIKMIQEWDTVSHPEKSRKVVEEEMVRAFNSWPWKYTNGHLYSSFSIGDDILDAWTRGDLVLIADFDGKQVLPIADDEETT